jgi:hypothetical protein
MHWARQSRLAGLLRVVPGNLAPGGVTANTVFALDDFAREQIQLKKATHLFIHEDNGFYWYYDPDPLMGNGFDRQLITNLHTEAGFKDVRVVEGTWTGRTGPFYQDLITARKD